MNPRRGLKPPLPSSSRSETLRSFKWRTGSAAARSRSASRSSPRTVRSMSSPPWAGIVSCMYASCPPLVQATLLVLRVLPPPAAGADVLPRLDGAGAGRAADAGEAAVVEGVVGGGVRLDVVPGLLLAPVDQRVDLGDAA